MQHRDVGPQQQCTCVQTVKALYGRFGMSSQRPRIFYGWIVVFTAGIGLLLGYAPVFVYSFSVFIKSLAQDFHTSRTSISFAFTLANLMQSVGAPLIGRLVDRFGAQKVIVPSTVIFALVLISFKYSSTSLWQLIRVFHRDRLHRHRERHLCLTAS